MALLALLQKKFFRRFLDGRPGPWGVMAVGIFGLRTLWRWSRRTEDVSYRTVLKPGESLTISHTPDTEKSLKKQDKARRRAAKRQHGGAAPEVTVERGA